MVRPALASLVVVLTMAFGCAHHPAPDTTEASNAKLATQLVAWDVARRSAEAKLLTVPLPGIAVREEPIPDDPTLANASPTASVSAGSTTRCTA
jgi:hypothetical protein